MLSNITSDKYLKGARLTFSEGSTWLSGRFRRKLGLSLAPPDPSLHSTPNLYKCYVLNIKI